MGRVCFLVFSMAGWMFVFSSSSVSGPSFFQELFEIPAEFVFPSTQIFGSYSLMTGLPGGHPGALLLAPGFSCFR